MVQGIVHAHVFWQEADAQSWWNIMNDFPAFFKKTNKFSCIPPHALQVP